MPFLVVANPASGDGNALKLLKSLGSSPFVRDLAVRSGASESSTWPVLETTADGAWKSELKSRLSSLNTVLVLGGDGTLKEAASVLADAKSKASLFAAPGGRGNDFVRGAYEYTAAEGDFWKWAAKKEWAPRAVDLATGNGKLFINMASLGYGGRVVENAQGRKAFWSKTSMVYQVEGALALFESSHGDCTVTADGQVVYQGPFFGAFVGNGKANGSGLYWTASARVDDGKINAIVFSRPGVLEMAKTMSAIKKKLPPAFFHKTAEAREIIFEYTQPEAMELDGDFAGKSQKQSFSCLVHAISMWMPKL